MPHRHLERHIAGRIGWLRAAVLGANDGIVSTASLILGVAAADASAHAILTAGAAGLVAGAMSMAAGEYVSVSSQADAERAEVALEQSELLAHPEQERAELEGIYRSRGLDADLARRVADQLTAKDALAAHVRDELNLTEAQRARPIQAAFASAASFSAGAIMPLIVALTLPGPFLRVAVCAASLAALAILGLLSSRGAGAKPWKATARVVFWGAAAMAITTGVGELFGAAI